MILKLDYCEVSTIGATLPSVGGCSSSFFWYGWGRCLFIWNILLLKISGTFLFYGNFCRSLSRSRSPLASPPRRKHGHRTPSISPGRVSRSPSVRSDRSRSVDSDC
ncbi:hypothetical protein NC651_029661 [Populus alba x Populus x berolinensis]|nr:hypothetical protein NC651_029661 [Populus alba x Populus x berolinensis]